MKESDQVDRAAIEAHLMERFGWIPSMDAVRKVDERHADAVENHRITEEWIAQQADPVLVRVSRFLG